MEVCCVGYGDKKDVEGWLMLDFRVFFVYILIIIVWIVLCYYVVVNFGQYEYVGFMFNYLIMI